MHLLKKYLTHQNLSTYRLDGFSTFKFIFMVSHMSAGNIKCLADVQSTFRNRISTEWHWNLNIYEIQTLGNFEHCFSIYKWSSYLLPLWLFQIMEVKRCLVAATGLCEGESGHYGKEESEALDLLPARYWNSRVPWTVSSSTSPTGCLHLSAWQEETPQARSRWTASMCGTRSGELGLFFFFFKLSRSVTGLEGEVGCSLEGFCEWYQLLSLTACPVLVPLSDPPPPPPHARTLQLPLFSSRRSPCFFNKPFVAVALRAQREGNCISHSHTNL